MYSPNGGVCHQQLNLIRRLLSGRPTAVSLAVALLTFAFFLAAGRPWVEPIQEFVAGIDHGSPSRDVLSV